MAKGDKLSDKQRLFVAGYLIDLNATNAAIKAGYSKKTAKDIGAENLSKPLIKAAIQAEMDKKASKFDISADAVIQEIAKLAFSNPQDYYHANGAPKEIHELTRDQAAAINTIKTNMTDECAVLELKMHDKGQNLERLGRHLKLFTDKVEVDVSESLAATLKAARERVSKA